MENNNNNTALTNTFKSALVKAQDTYLTMIAKQMDGYGLAFDNYQKECCRAAIASINDLLFTSNLKFNDIDQSNLSEVLTTTAILKLNPVAMPREVYFKITNTRVGDKYVKRVQMGVEGAGNDAILRNFGVGVKNVMTPIIVHEGDEVTLPYYDGEKMCPPTWKPKSYHGKVTMVIYVINKVDGTKEYAIAEREGVVANLVAHIVNNLRSAPAEVKEPIIEKVESMELEEILNDKSLRGKVEWTDNYGKKQSVTIISPAWTQASSREAMLERKMRNNATKKIQKDLNPLAQKCYEETFEDYDQYREKEIIDFTTKKAITSMDDIEKQVDSSTNIKSIPQQTQQPINSATIPTVEQEVNAPAEEVTQEPTNAAEDGWML